MIEKLAINKMRQWPETKGGNSDCTSRQFLSRMCQIIWIGSPTNLVYLWL
ncbi:hypothetical protein [uncultured Citrobacter sp.]|nr:hypothetical protein [uncultured Citrobacter sp.]